MIELPGNDWQETFILLKPEALENYKVGFILNIFEESNLQVASIRSVVATDTQVREHYREYTDNEEVFGRLSSQLIGKKVIAAVLEGEYAVELVDHLVGPFKRAERELEPQSLRAQLMSPDDPEHLNFIHRAKTAAAAQREKLIWLPMETIEQIKAVGDLVRGQKFVSSTGQT